MVPKKYFWFIPLFACLNLLFLSEGRSDDFSLRWDDSTLRSKVSNEDRQRLEEFLESTVQLLPQKLKKGINRSIQVGLIGLRSEERLKPPSCHFNPGNEIDASSNGRADGKKAVWYSHRSHWGHSISLNVLFLPEILAGPENAQTYPCGHRNLYKFAQARIIHELARIYDAKKQLSDHHRFKLQVGTADNRDHKRSVDPREYESPEHALAVNLEYLLLDPEYSCRRPSISDFLAKKFQIELPPCEVNYNVLANLRDQTQNAPKSVNIDPDRIYQIRLLEAAPGHDIASRFGHTMFHIVRCNEAREFKGPECLQDIDDHLVLSYAGFLGFQKMSAWKGLSGYYSSHLFVYTFPDVLKYYTQVEGRDLSSAPFKFTDQQIRNFMNFAVEQYWQYSGSYRFITENCNTEARHHLQSVLKRHHFSGLTPESLLHNLADYGILDESVLTPRESAIAGGYVYEGQKGMSVGESASATPSEREAHAIEGSLERMLSSGRIVEGYGVPRFDEYQQWIEDLNQRLSQDPAQIGQSL